jgi:selenocysteine lyase/cysteine desulfurase
VDAQIRSAPGHYLDSATYGLPSDETVAALHASTEAWRAGTADWIEDWDRAGEDCRGLYAQIVGVPPERVALLPAASAGVGLVASSLPAGSRVLVAEEEFTSVLFPFLEQQRVRGVQVRAVPLAQLPAAIDESVGLVAVSHVQSASGQMTDVDALLDACRSVGARLMLDITQAVGAVAPVRAWRDADYVVAAAYKWLCAPRGVAFLSVAPDGAPELAAINAGWRAGDDPYGTFYGPPLRLAGTARRLDVSLAWLAWVGAAQALREFAGDPDDMAAQHRHRRELVQAFCGAVGVQDPGAGIVSLAVPDLSVAQALAARGIKASVRHGRVRLSFHHYNDHDDVTAAAAALTGLVAS